jgi:hypothetical protein
MKRLGFLIIAVFVFGMANAQSNAEQVDLIQSVFGMEKKAIVAEFIEVDPSQSDAFWKLYDEYEGKRKELGKRRIELLTQYAEGFENLNNESAESWTKEAINLAAKTDKLLVSYQKKISKATNPIVALQFYQVEEYILTGIRMSILEELPLPDVK